MWKLNYISNWQYKCVPCNVPLSRLQAPCQTMWETQGPMNHKLVLEEDIVGTQANGRSPILQEGTGTWKQERWWG